LAEDIRKDIPPEEWERILAANPCPSCAVLQAKIDAAEGKMRFADLCRGRAEQACDCYRDLLMALDAKLVQTEKALVAIEQQRDQEMRASCYAQDKGTPTAEFAVPSVVRKAARLQWGAEEAARLFPEKEVKE
jgi:hypothetical protein